jgi:hypothetical protein
MFLAPTATSGASTGVRTLIFCRPIAQTEPPGNINVITVIALMGGRNIIGIALALLENSLGNLLNGTGAHLAIVAIARPEHFRLKAGQRNATTVWQASSRLRRASTPIVMIALPASTVPRREALHAPTARPENTIPRWEALHAPTARRTPTQVWAARFWRPAHATMGTRAAAMIVSRVPPENTKAQVVQ